MAKVILHVGDTVTHSSLGEGVVTIVDKEYVTIKFASDELTFRLPDAFRKGFLSSDDAEIIGDLNDEDDDDDEDEDDDDDEDDDEEEIEELSEIKPSVTPDPKKNSPGCLVVAVSLIVPLIVFVPLELFFGYLYDNTDDGVYLFFMILGLLFYALIVIVLIKTVPEDSSAYGSYSSHKSYSSHARRYTPRSFYKPSKGNSIFTGGTSWGSSRKKSKSLFDGIQDDLYWQRKHSSHRW